LLEGVSAEPLSWTSYTLSQQAVNVFFILSGMLLSQSIAQNPNWTRFLAARALRILPGLFVCGIIVGWIVGPLATSMNLSEFLTDARTIFYPILSVIFFDKTELHEVLLKSTQLGANVTFRVIQTNRCSSGNDPAKGSGVI
jgi:peptidoglycan/LPS O-acetylase OafA/YrhL